MKKLSSIQYLVAIALILLGATVMLGWLSHNAPMVRIGTEYRAMVFGAAWCFFLLGIALAASLLPTQHSARIREGIGWGLFITAFTVFLANLGDTDFVLDFPFVHAWLNENNSHPGRLPLNSSIGFMLAGFVLLLMHRVRSKLAGMAVLAANFSILMMGLIGVAGYFLHLDLLYPWFNAIRMAPQSTVGMTLAAIGMWSIWSRLDWYRTQRYFKTDEKTGYTAATLLAVITLTAGIVGFAVQQSTLEKILSENLAGQLKSQSLLFETAISNGVVHAESATMHADLIHLLRSSTVPSGTIVGELLAEDFSGVAIYDLHNREVARGGHFSSNSPIEKELGLPIPASLHWDGMLRLNSRSAIHDHGKVIGILEVEQPLSAIEKQLAQTEGLGATGEIGLCFRQGDWLRCFPQGRNPKVHSFSPRLASGQLTPMGYATDGRTGIVKTLDYRGQQVIAAYGPLTGNGLGIVVKQDAVELYQPIREQLQWFAPLLLLLVTSGAMLLRSQVKPLVAKLLISEAQASRDGLHIRTVLANVGEGIMTVNEMGKIESFNFAAARIFGFSPEEAIGLNVDMLMPDDSCDLHDAGMRRYLPANSTPGLGAHGLEVRGLRKDGTVFPMEISVNEMRSGQQPLFIFIVRDVTERKAAERALHESEARSREITETLGEGVVVTDRQGTLVFCNPAAQRLLGWTQDEMLGRNGHELFHHTRPDGSPYPAEECETARAASSGFSFRSHDETFWRKDGSMLPVSVNSTPIIRDGAVAGAVLAFHDIIERKKAAEQVHHLAHYDILTDLPNRALLRDRLQQAIANARREKHRLALMFIDLDKFKPVNDTLGHDVGDLLLKEVAQRLRGCLRESDTVARVGGDEFVVLLPKIEDARDAITVARKILDALNRTFDIGSHAVHVSGSIGVAVYPEHGAGEEQLVKSADSAMYHAKKGGGGAVILFSELEPASL